jgi:hypothetical protein
MFAQVRKPFAGSQPNTIPGMRSVHPNLLIPNDDEAH